MPLTIKTFANFFSSITSKFFNILTGIDPNVEGSLAKSMAVSSAAAGYTLQDGIQDAVNQSFPQTADDDFLALFGGYDNTPRFPATAASGFVAVGGILTTLVPQFTNLNYNSLVYQTLQAVNVASYTGAISMVYNANGTVTVTTALPHTLSSGLTATISGASQSAYNGPFSIIVLSTTVFTYSLAAGLGLSPDAGTYVSVYALLNVQATTQGINTNVGSGSSLSISVVNINSSGFVGIGGLTGGTDLEDINLYRIRVLQAHNLTPGVATPPSIITAAKKISGITRVYVVAAVNSAVQIAARGTAGYIPLLGESVVYALQDNTIPITPNNTTLTAIYNQIFADGLWPNFIPAGNLWILAPNLISQNVGLGGIIPNTPSMQTAITTQLTTFFLENANVGQNVSYKALIAFLNQIQDPNTGLFLQFYNLLTPTSDMVAVSGQLYILGSVTFS